MSDDKLDIYGSPEDFKKIDLDFPELHPHQLEFIEHLQAKVNAAVGIGRGLLQPMVYISPPDPNMHRMMDMMDTLHDHPTPVLIAGRDDFCVPKGEEVLIAESMIDAVKLAKEGNMPVLYVDSYGGFGGPSFAKAMADEFERMSYVVAAEPGSQAPNDLLHDERNVPKRFGNNKKWNDHRRQKAMAKASRRKNRKGK